MIQIDRLTQFYLSQYEQVATKKGIKVNRYPDFDAYAARFARTLSRARAARLNHLMLADYHKQTKNIYCFALRRKRERSLALMREEVIPRLVRLDLDFLLPEQREGIDGEFLAFMEQRLPERICAESLFDLYPLYRQYKIQNKIFDLVPTRPELEFPETLAMKRHFILHIGPTNSGKTFQSLRRLRTASHGVYLGPLRLLALEVYEKMREYDVPCTMLTGQECIEDEDSRVTASTIEMADFDDTYDIAVIDEAQMMADPDRGHSWTKAILGLRAQEIHICTSPTAEAVLKHLITVCGDDYTVNRYKRKTKLVCEEEPFCFPEDVRPGDALIVFSKKSVLDVAGRLEEEHIDASVIYGSLPPEIRRRQMHLFTRKKTKVVVATDAIGMGLNLPVRRIVFLQTDKFDGTSRRPLQVSEIRQIAGRAGRFGIYNTGYINAMGEEALDFIREKWAEEEQPVTKVNLGFPQVLLDIDEPLDAILRVWHDVTPEKPFEKENVDEALFLYDRARKVREQIDGFDNKRLLYRMITCPIDIKDRDVVALWLEYCRTYSADVSLKRPVIPGRRNSRGLAQYESYYKQLDLYFQFSKRLGKVIDEKWLKRERERTEAFIMRYLAKDKQEYIARCQYCARPLPLGYPFRICQRCYEED